MDENSAQLLIRWQRGDEEAGETLFAQYVTRLVELARSRLPLRMQARFDPEDVVQSAYRSFFRAARTSDYRLERSGDLWRLLAAITINKLRTRIEYHRADKRSVELEIRLPSQNDEVRSVRVPSDALAKEPRPDEAVALTEELEHLLENLEPLHRQVVERRLAEETVAEIAAAVSRTERTVRRILNQARDQLEQRLQSIQA